MLLRWFIRQSDLSSCIVLGPYTCQSEGEPGKGRPKRLNAAQTDPRMGQILQEFIWWFRPFTLDRCHPLFYCLFDPG